jgi:hypothetical protein
VLLICGPFVLRRIERESYGEYGRKQKTNKKMDKIGIKTDQNDLTLENDYITLV